MISFVDKDGEKQYLKTPVSIRVSKTPGTMMVVTTVMAVFALYPLDHAGVVCMMLIIFMAECVRRC